jgi:hypothetical protein
MWCSCENGKGIVQAFQQHLLESRYTTGLRKSTMREFAPDGVL